MGTDKSLLENRYDTARPIKRNPLGRCGKVCFDKRQAQTKKNQLEREGRERLRIYCCERCNDSWHITSKL